MLWQVDIGNGGLNATPTASGDLLVVGRSGRGGTSFYAIKSGTDEQLASARSVVAKNILPAVDKVRFWSTPAWTDGTLFIRSSKTLYAIGSNSS